MIRIWEKTLAHTGISKTGIPVLLISILLSCLSPKHRSCVKGGKEYCINTDWIYVIDWDACYRRE